MNKMLEYTSRGFTVYVAFVPDGCYATVKNKNDEEVDSTRVLPDLDTLKIVVDDIIDRQHLIPQFYGG